MDQDPYKEKRRVQRFEDFSRGMAMGLSPGVVPAEASLWSINFDSARGGLRSRRGRERVGNRLPGASATCYWLGQYRKREADGTVTKQTLRINHQDLFELVGSTWTHRGSVGAGQLVCGYQFVNRMWWGDGLVAGTVWDGDTVQPWSQAAPASAPVHKSVAAAGGHLFTGDIYFTLFVPYCSATGEKINPSPTLSRTMSDHATNTQLWTVTLPSMDLPSRFDKAWVYRTAANEAWPQYESEVDYVGVAKDVTVGTREDTNLGEFVEYDNDPVPKLEFFTEHQSRLFGVERLDPSVLRWSKLNRPWSWPTANAMNIALDDGDDIEGLLPEFHGVLTVFKRRAAYVVVDDPVYIYAHLGLPREAGVLSHYSIVVVGNYAYGYDEKGMWVYNGAQFQRPANPVMDFFLDARRNAQSLQAVAIHDGRADRPYYRCVLDGPDPRDMSVTRQWWVSMLETTGGISLVMGWPANVLARIEGTGNIPEIWSGDLLGAVYRHFEDADGNDLYYDEDADAVRQDIEVDHQSPHIALGHDDETATVHAHEHKQVHALYVELERSDGPPPALVFTAIPDGVEASWHTVSGADSGVITVADHKRLGGTPCRRFGFRIHATGTYDARVTGVVIGYTPIGLHLRGAP